MRTKHAFTLFCVLSMLIICLSLPQLLAEEAKLNAEDVVARHLASIGAPEARAAVKSRIMSGSVQMVYLLGGSGQLSGKINILSEDRKVRVGMNLGAIDYPGDQFAFDGDKVTVGQIRSRVRSSFSEFLYNNDYIVKEGLLCGTLSTTWPLLDVKGRQGKLNYAGLKTIDEKQLHEVQYTPKKRGGEMQVYFYFDPENFRHVRTRIRFVQPDRASTTIGASSGFQGTVYILDEKFDNFEVVDGLTLPQKYVLELTVNSEAGSLIIHWDTTFSQTAHNQQIDPKYFTVKFQ